MDKIQKLAQDMRDAVVKHVGQALSPVVSRLEALESRTPEKGEKGDPGTFDPALLTPHLEEHARSFDALREELAARVDKWILDFPVPQHGKDADIGPVAAKLEADLASGLEKLRRDVADAVAGIRVPKDGDPGKDADPEFIKAEVAKAVAEIPKPKDGESVHPDTIARMVSAEVTKALALIPPAKDGDPGKDALQVDPLPFIDETKSYPRGTWASYAGGLIRAERATEPLTESLEKSGWAVIVEGVAGVVVEQGDNPREFAVTTLLTSGLKATTPISIPAMIYRGIWKEGEYERGDVVTDDGSGWHCQVDKTTARPGTSDDWKLIVKRGRDGKAPTPPSVRGPVRTG